MAEARKRALRRSRRSPRRRGARCCRPPRLVGFGETFYVEPHVHTGYRVPSGTADSLRSVFQWHNESANIWSMLAGAVLYAWLVWRKVGAELPGDGAHRSHGLVFAVLGVGITGAFLTSAMAHTFASQTLALRTFLFQCDYATIYLTAVASAAIQAAYALPWYAETVALPGLAACCGAALLAFAMLCYQRWRQQRRGTERAVAGRNQAAVRAVTFFAVAAIVYGPYVHRACRYLRVGAQAPHEEEALLYATLSLGFMALGGLCYGAHFPECAFPGRFDYFPGQAWMHCFFVAANVCHWRYSEAGYRDHVHRLGASAPVPFLRGWGGGHRQ